VTVKGEIEYLVERLRPHLLEVGRGVFIYVHGGAVLKRLPISQVAVGLHGSYFPEVLLRVGGLAIAPNLSVQGLPGWKRVFEQSDRPAPIHVPRHATSAPRETYCTGEKLYLIVKLHSFCKVSVGFSLKRSAGDRLGPDFTPKDAAHDIIILQRPVKPGEESNL